MSRQCITANVFWFCPSVIVIFQGMLKAPGQNLEFVIIAISVYLIGCTYE